MNRFGSLWLCLSLLGLAGCSGSSERVCRFGEEASLPPFVLKVVKAEYGDDGDKIALKISLEAANRSSDKNSLSRNRFALRVGKTREVERDRTFRESIGLETISFDPNETATVTVSFVLSKDALDQRLALIVDRQEKNGKERLTLIEVKDGSPPKNLPAKGEWRVVRSARWE
ncbi:MAG: hypothetical protein HY360_18685 [Verrucomicrobia bacterium]|nr:hypothetical protein [Verrucomicrobiota bacterium]